MEIVEIVGTKGENAMQIFLSHSSKDADVALKICEQLEKNGTKCFIAPRDIRPGKEYAEEIINGIEESAAVVLLMSGAANRSPHVLREVEHAVSGGTPILVYKLEDVVLSKSMEYFLMTHQWVSSKPQEDYADIVAFARDLAEKEKESGRSAGTDGGTDKSAQDGNPAASGTNQAMVSQKADSGASGQGSSSGSGGKNGNLRKRAGIIAAAVAVLAIVFIALFAMRKHGAGDADAEKAGAVPVSVQVGDTVRFGSYLDEDIEWRVLRLSEDKTQAVLVTSHIVTMKAYDAAESGRFNYDGDTDYWSSGETQADTDMALQVRVRGNSDWSLSNLRTWLNADTEVVNYTGQAPAASAMAEKKNGYQNEAGFLHGFTKEERDAIVETQIVTNGNALSESETVTTYDRVWLLSMEELAWFDEAGISKFTSPTDAAVEQDQSFWYSVDYDAYGVEYLCWWLREPVAEAGSLCYLVDNGYRDNVVRQENAGLEGFGVRPALTVDLRYVTFRGEEDGK